MCARYNLRLSPSELREVFDLLREPEWEPRFNIAPTQSIAAVVVGDEGREGRLVRWGLVPSWSKEPRTKFPLINAKAETVATKPSFRAAFARRRCLVPATGFYEWTGPRGRKQPWHVTVGDEPFAFAGLWDRWGDELESATVVTCAANELMAPIHDRMPVILPREAWDAWLDPGAERAELESLLVPFDAGAMRAVEVNPVVGAYRITPKKAELVWRMIDGESSWFENHMDSCAKRRVLIRDGLVFVHTHNKHGDVKRRTLNVLDERTGKLVAIDEEWNGGSQMFLVEDQLLHVVDACHGDRLTMRLLDATPNGDTLRAPSDPWKPPHSSTTGYEVFMEIPYVNGRIYLRTHAGDVRCYELTKKS